MGKGKGGFFGKLKKEVKKVQPAALSISEQDKKEFNTELKATKQVAINRGYTADEVKAAFKDFKSTHLNPVSFFSKSKEELRDKEIPRLKAEFLTRFPEKNIVNNNATPEQESAVSSVPTLGNHSNNE